MLDWEQVRTRANGDGEFRMHARFWNSKIRLKIGDRRYQMVVDSGEIVSIERWYRGTACDLSIMAPEQDWDALLEVVPRPFYQDLYPATLHHGFDVAGDIGHYCAYYPAIRRLIDVMREVNNGGGAAETMA